MNYESMDKGELLKRAKSRALYLLGDMPRTERPLREKLEKTGYPPETIDEVIEYVKEYHYIDDLQYAKDYIAAKSQSKSKRVVFMDLQRKGISKEIMEQIQDCFSEETQNALLEQLIAKKKIDMQTASREELHRLYQYLLRKGFSYEEIRGAIERERSDWY